MTASDDRMSVLEQENGTSAHHPEAMADAPLTRPPITLRPCARALMTPILLLVLLITTAAPFSLLHFGDEHGHKHAMALQQLRRVQRPSLPLMDWFRGDPGEVQGGGTVTGDAMSGSDHMDVASGAPSSGLEQQLLRGIDKGTVGSQFNNRASTAAAEAAASASASLSSSHRHTSQLHGHGHDHFHHSHMHGYWGPASSTVDWCEPNYVFSHYVAEMFNSRWRKA